MLTKNDLYLLASHQKVIVLFPENIPEQWAAPAAGVLFMSPLRRRQSFMAEILNALASDLGIVILVVLALVGVYQLDTITPLGTPVWLLYLVPLVISFWSDRYYAIPAVCLGTLLFLAGGFIVSPSGVPVMAAVQYRFTFFIVFIGAAIFLWVIRRQDIITENLR